MYLYRAIDGNGDTVEFYFSKDRDLKAAKRFICKALARHGRPDCITIDGSQTNRMAIVQCDTESQLKGPRTEGRRRIAIRSSKYLTDVFDKGHLFRRERFISRHSLRLTTEERADVLQ